MQNRLKTVAAAMLLLLVAGRSADAALVVVDPDAFAAGTDISNSFGGVDLSAVGGGFGSGPSVFSIVSATQGAEPFTASTGTRVFGTNSASFPHLFREPGFLQLRADFDSPTDLVRIDFISNDDSDVGLLRAFNAANVQIGSYTTASLTANQFETMTINVPNIAYILAGGDSGGSSGGLDNLRFNAVDLPEPATAALGLMGTLTLVLRRRRIA